ncbi:respiratory nitrate reductase subunit gamma [Streptomyces natalensis]|uniref:NarG-like domain-containing protein n=1 Tax=Streptomyces natalensis ATCC 27448 TaxID=1240678 RepID=A0A0D7CGQ6_9ACTN|nr:hypothetical protein SNA_31365 [Streptomyces natalensis ATCC 27448]
MAPISGPISSTACGTLFALWPFNRLVHAFTAPVGYLVRPYVVYRSRTPAARYRHPAVGAAREISGRRRR